jgi:hypothetical protein
LLRQGSASKRREVVAVTAASGLALLPGANSPQTLTRLLEAAARGIRSTRALQETLGVQAPTVRAYVFAGVWLGLVEASDPIELSPLGLEYVYAGPRRTHVYARAVWSNPLAAELLVAGDGRLPDAAEVERVLALAEPDLAPATLRRRASAVRSLIAPAIGRPRPRSRPEDERQLELPLAHAPATALLPSLAGRAAEHDPEAYRVILGALLENGELSLGHLRALLDRAGADAMPVGGLVELALLRGDALRTGDRLVATRGAVARRDLAASVPSIVLSDPAWRASLSDALAASSDRGAAIRRDTASPRLRAWDRRLFGRPIHPATLPSDLDRVLLDRPLDAFTLATPDPGEPPPVTGPFLEVWDQPGLHVARPAWLAQLQGGVAAVHAILRRTRQAGSVTVPDLGDVQVATHAGLFPPGERGGWVVTDSRSLRLRALTSSPVVTLAGAVLVLHRQRPERVSVVEDRGGWSIQVAGRSTPVFALLDAFAESRGWLSCRGPSGGLAPAVWVRVLEALGVATLLGRQLVLAEPLFARAHGEADEAEVFARLVELSHAIESFLDRGEEEG